MVEVTKTAKIKPKNEHSEYWFTVEDKYIDVDFPTTGCTISYWEDQFDDLTGETRDERVKYLCLNVDEALAIADAIYYLYSEKK
jgi:hypothetical protein